MEEVDTRVDSLPSNSGEETEADNDSSSNNSNTSSSSAPRKPGTDTGTNKRAYNSQLFNYEMIVDLIDEVYEEVWASDAQLVIMENKLRDLKTRYARWKSKKGKNAAYSLKLQIAAVEGVKFMYEEYNAKKRVKLDRLRSYTL